MVPGSGPTAGDDASASTGLGMTPLGSFLRVSAERKRQVLRDIESGSTPRTLYYLLMMVSAGIAAFGLLQNSAAVVIGAMLVSPLMTPIFGIGLALSRGDLVLLRKSLQAEVGGVVVTIAFAFLLGLLPFALEVTPEMLARTRPNLIDLLVAALAGLAGGLALVDENTSPALPGVAIATALVPPLATSGLSLSFGAYDGAGGAFLLFFANFLAILAVSAATFQMAGLVTRFEVGSAAARAKRFAAAGIGLVAVAALLTRSLLVVIENWREDQALRQTLAEQLADQPGATLASLIHDQLDDGRINVLATVRAPRVFTPRTVKSMQDALSERLGDPVSLFVRCTLTRDVTAEGSAELLPAVDLDGDFVAATPSPSLRVRQIAEQVLRELLGEASGTTLDDVELLEFPSGRVVVATISSSQVPVPLQMRNAEALVRERTGDPAVTLLARTERTDDVTAKGRILLGAAHFAKLTPEQREQQSAIEAAGQSALAALRDTFVDAIDAAPDGAAWTVRASVTAPTVPSPAEIASIEKELAEIARGPVSLTIWAATSLVVDRDGYASVQSYIESRMTAGAESDDALPGTSEPAPQ